MYVLASTDSLTPSHAALSLLCLVLRSRLGFIASPINLAITSILQRVLSTYIKDIELEGMGLLRDLELYNLELRLDVLQDKLFLPLGFQFSRGFIRKVNCNPYVTILLYRVFITHLPRLHPQAHNLGACKAVVH